MSQNAIYFQNTFSIVRSRGGHNSCPTLEQARSAVRALCFNQLLRPLTSNANCDCNDFESTILATSDVPIENSEKESKIIEWIDAPRLPVDHVITPTLKADNIDLEVQGYIYGHILRRFITCTECLHSMTNDAPKNNLINFKTLQNCKLINPKMNPLLKDLQEFVKDSLYVIGHLPKISEILYQEAEERFNVEFDFCSGKCRESFHTILLAETIKFYIRLHCKRLNDLLRTEWHKNGK